MIDPRLFLGIGGPVGPQAPLPPGFRPPGPPPGAPMMQPQGQQAMTGIPGFGMSMGRAGNPAQKPPGMPSPNQYGVLDPEAVNSAYPGDPATMNPAAAGIGTAAVPGSFLSWLRGLF